jgi:hypothetical protein
MGNSGSVDPSEYLDKVIEGKSFIEKLFEQKWRFHGDSLPLEQILAIVPDTTVPNWEYRYYMSKTNAVRNGKTFTKKRSQIRSFDAFFQRSRSAAVI